jgi:hypothetical protein
LELAKLSTARCARVSYLTHDGKRDPREDFALHDRLSENGHWSPFEHAAQCKYEFYDSSSNFACWRQYRKFFAGEAVAKRKEAA